MDPRLSVLPPEFLRNPHIIADQTFIGTPKQSGSDNHAHTPVRLDRPIIYIDCIFDAAGAAEALKFSRHWWIAIIGGESRGGVEDCIDITRGGHLYFYQHTFSRGPAKQDVTLKGGARSITFHDCRNLHLLVLGEYTKYDHHAIYPDGSKRRALPWQLARPPVRSVNIINCGAPVVECIHAETPAGACAVSTKFRPYAAPYFWARSTFFRETNPAPAAEFVVDPRELQTA